MSSSSQQLQPILTRYRCHIPRIAYSDAFFTTTMEANARLVAQQYRGCWKRMLLDRPHLRFDGGPRGPRGHGAGGHAVGLGREGMLWALPLPLPLLLSGICCAWRVLHTSLPAAVA